ncbi:MAG: hypothetical protein QG579_422 [Patescibacteria group bacterium]|nr:hypothetical protein [Patescibacteria group bacterium]
MLYLLYYLSSNFMTNIVVIVLMIFLLTKFSKLKKEIKDIKSELALLKDNRPQGAVNTMAEPSYTESALMSGQTLNPVEMSWKQSTNNTARPEPEEESAFVSWFKENPLLKIGVLMIIIGFGWFVSYAFSHDWIGPVGRITLGVLAGVLVTLYGTFKLGKNETQANALMVLGSALMIVTLIAGSYLYHFYPPFLLLLMVFIISLYVSLSAMAHSYKKLAVYGLLISLIAPIISSAKLASEVLYIYLAIVSVTTIWISVAKKWTEVILVGITGVLIYSMPYILGGNIDFAVSKYVVLFIVYGISLLYLWMNIWGLVQNKLKADAQDVYLAIVNTLIILGFTVRIVPTVYQSLVIAGWMLVYAISGFFVFEKTKNEKLFYIHSLISILLLAIATSIELSGETLVIALAIEAAIISVASFVVTNKIKIAESFSVLLAVPLIMSMESFYSSKWGIGVFHSDFAVLAIMALILALLGFFYKINKDDGESEVRPHHIMFILSTAFFYSIIWLSMKSIIGGDTAVFVSLFIYTVIGLTCHFYGIFNQNSVFKKYGMALLILVVARLVFVDVWNMELVVRVITFIVLGIMFMSSAFISKSQKHPNDIIQN